MDRGVTVARIEAPRAALRIATMGFVARLSTGAWARRVGVVRRRPMWATRE